LASIDETTAAHQRSETLEDPPPSIVIDPTERFQLSGDVGPSAFVVAHKPA
jgi:hypothetical protein